MSHLPAFNHRSNKAENWHALSHEQCSSKHHFLDICQSALKELIILDFVNFPQKSTPWTKTMKSYQRGI